jgi:hypothetical protein
MTHQNVTPPQSLQVIQTPSSVGSTFARVIFHDPHTHGLAR